MKAAWLFPGEEGGQQTAPYWCSLFVCYYAATIFSVFIAITSGCGVEFFLIAVICGIGVDVARRFLAPELQLSPAERYDYIQRALNDKNTLQGCAKKYRRNAGAVYWLWGGIFY